MTDLDENPKNLEKEKLERDRLQDALNTEFIYHNSVLRNISPSLTNHTDRELVMPWLEKLFRPEYQSSKLKEKRNRYLTTLTITLLNDEIFGVFKTTPTDGALPELESLEKVVIPAAEWELDKCWQENLSSLSDDFVYFKCPVHAGEDCRGDHGLDQVMDQEFQFLLYLARPYAALVTGGDRVRAAAWMQALCSVQGKEYCSTMRGIRNDYMTALLGYLQDLRVVGPFLEYPPKTCLSTLADAVRNLSERKPITDPTGQDSDEFLINQPVPIDGAFCYIALTGDLINNTIF